MFDGSPEIQVLHVDVTERYDYSILAGDYRFTAEHKSNASAGSLAAAINSLERYAETKADSGLPLIVVPFMGQVGRQLCDQSRMSCLDLCGNAKIVAPGLRIWIEGRQNKYRVRGRPPNVFAPKSSRIARQLLLHPEPFQTQADFARQTGLGDGYVRKIVRRLGHGHYLDANEEGAVRPRDPTSCLTPGTTPTTSTAFDDKRLITLKGETLHHEHATREAWVCEAGAFTVLKALAFPSRGENKDAYDLIYILQNYGTGIDDVFQRLNPLLDAPSAQQALNILQQDFAEVDSMGAMRVAEFHGDPQDETIRADAAGAVRSLLALAGNHRSIENFYSTIPRPLFAARANQTQTTAARGIHRKHCYV